MNSGTFLAVLVLPPVVARPGDPRPSMSRKPAAAPSTRRGPAKPKGRHATHRSLA